MSAPSPLQRNQICTHGRFFISSTALAKRAFRAGAEFAPFEPGDDDADVLALVLFQRRVRRERRLQLLGVPRGGAGRVRKSSWRTEAEALWEDRDEAADMVQG